MQSVFRDFINIYHFCWKSVINDLFLLTNVGYLWCCSNMKLKDKRVNLDLLEDIDQNRFYERHKKMTENLKITAWNEHMKVSTKRERVYCSKYHAWRRFIILLHMNLIGFITCWPWPKIQFQVSSNKRNKKCSPSYGSWNQFFFLIAHSFHQCTLNTLV